MSTDLRPLADAVLDAIPGSYIICRTYFKALRPRDLQQQLDAGETTPRAVLVQISDHRMVAPHLAAQVAAALNAAGAP